MFGIQSFPYEASQPTLTFTRFEITKAKKPAAENSFSLTFGPNGSNGWANQFYPPSFRDTRIIEGDIYILTCSFTSDVDFEWFQVNIYDSINPVWRVLTPTVAVVQNVKANIEYSATVTLIAHESATDTSPLANMLRLEAVTFTPDQQPTLTFTKLEITKVDKPAAETPSP